MPTLVLSDMQPAVKLSEEMEPVTVPVEGIELVCDVCGEHTDEMFVDVDSYWIVCKQHRVNR